MATYLTTASAKDASNIAEALGRAYATRIGKPWPMPPDSYGPGRQPTPRAKYYQRYYVAPIPDPSVKLPDANTALVLLVDAEVTSLDGTKVTLTDGSRVTIDVSKAVIINAAETVAQPVGK